VTNPSSLTASVNVVVAAPVTYTVTYNANSTTATGIAPTDSTQYASGATVNVLNNTGSLVLAGYTFGGWSLTSTGAAISGTSFTMPAANTTLYAVWVPSGTAAEAAAVTSVAVPAQDATSLTLPAVPTGFTIAIYSSDTPLVIATTGTITPPASQTTVNLVFTVTRTADGTTANTGIIAVVVPAA
jgi:uncharacterized repeat protein (TIGR02543 family)